MAEYREDVWIWTRPDGVTDWVYAEDLKKGKITSVEGTTITIDLPDGRIIIVTSNDGFEMEGAET